jgi:hypothetical protein
MGLGLGKALLADEHLLNRICCSPLETITRRQPDVDYNTPTHPQVETLVELRSMHLEDMGKMSRFGPLAVMEITK